MNIKIRIILALSRLICINICNLDARIDSRFRLTDRQTSYDSKYYLQVPKFSETQKVFSNTENLNCNNGI